MLTSLCRPALSDEAFVAPATAREIAVDLVVTEAAVKQHLLRLYQKFRIPEGTNRRVRLANEVVALGLVRPLPQAELPRGLRLNGPSPPPARCRRRPSPARPIRWPPAPGLSPAAGHAGIQRGHPGARPSGCRRPRAPAAWHSRDKLKWCSRPDTNGRCVRLRLTW